MHQISVVVPVKNDLSGMQRLLECLRKQTVEHELTVVDNGSTDGTVEFLVSQGINVLSFPELRVGAMRNRGVEKTTAPYLAFADSDHEVYADWLENGIRVLNSDPNIAACGSHYLAPEKGTWVQRVWAIHRLRGADLIDVDWLASGNLFVRRANFDAIGGFRENLVAAEDADLCHRLKDQGGRIFLDQRIASIHHGEARTVAHFIRKEWWRGSSGVYAWISHGFPFQEFKSLVWPLWNLVFPILIPIALLISLQYFSLSIVLSLLLLLVVFWILPSLALATVVGKNATLVDKFLLAFLYSVYGVTRGLALFRK